MGPVLWHRAVRRVPFGAQNDGANPLPLAQEIELPATKALCTVEGLLNERSMYMSFCILYSVIYILYSVFCILCSVFCFL
jgi:hypothetical protein